MEIIVFMIALALLPLGFAYHVADKAHKAAVTDFDDMKEYRQMLMVKQFTYAGLVAFANVIVLVLAWSIVTLREFDEPLTHYVFAVFCVVVFDIVYLTYVYNKNGQSMDRQLATERARHSIKEVS